MHSFGLPVLDASVRVPRQHPQRHHNTRGLTAMMLLKSNSHPYDYHSRLYDFFLTVRSEQPENSAISTVDLSAFGPGKGNHKKLLQVCPCDTATTVLRISIMQVAHDL